jgi:hypothetical protein
MVSRQQTFDDWYEAEFDYLSDRDDYSKYNFSLEKAREKEAAKKPSPCDKCAFKDHKG